MILIMFCEVFFGFVFDFFFVLVDNFYGSSMIFSCCEYVN